VLDYDDLLLYWAQMMSDHTLAEDVGGRFDHVLVDEYQDTNRLQSSIQARSIVERVLENREAGTLLKQQSVLFRASSHSGPLEIELTRRSIPFVKFGGLKFLDAAHIKDMLALLRFIENPRDRVAGFRLMQLLPGVRASPSAPWALPTASTKPQSGWRRRTPCARAGLR
jgi:superfamily I DNA/RNA helicase